MTKKARGSLAPSWKIYEQSLSTTEFPLRGGLL